MVQTHLTFTPGPVTHPFRLVAPSKGKPGYQFVTGHVDQSSRHHDGRATAEYGGKMKYTRVSKRSSQEDGLVAREAGKND